MRRFNPLRRDFLRALSLTGLTGLLPGRLRAAGTRKPNFVIFLTDDQKWDVVGYEGHPLARTPNIDSLAAAGVAFRNSFVTTPICASSRASLLSSTYFSRHRFNFGTVGMPLDLFDVSFPQVLGRNGYRTGLIGKLGVWFDDGYLAAVERRLGWASVDAGLFDVYQPVGRMPYISEDDDGVKRHELDKIDRRAQAFIGDQSMDRPFCLVIGFNDPHITGSTLGQGRYQPAAAEKYLFPQARVPVSDLNDPEVFEELPDILKTDETTGDEAWAWSGKDPSNEFVDYFRLIAGVDRIIGNILEKLRITNLYRNTVIIFTSDNGLSLGDRGLSGKWSHFDESIRVPLILCDPRNQTSAGTRPSELVLNVDVAPTILDLAGIPIPPAYQGMSLAAFLDAASQPDWRKEFLCEYEGDLGREIPDWIGLRSESYKFAHYLNAEPPVYFLNDLRTDPEEIDNLADDPAHQGLRDELEQRTLRYRALYAEAE
ncbi:MAG: sulfatase-like hydrolase/transferase [Proteobacteria bacterium]|nr:sulfatase-like hydrolase/transferase [Pseudomonadota bacterium]